VLDARAVVTDPSRFVDATHTSGRGAIVLSRAVGGVLKDELANGARDRVGGWIRLEPPPDLAGDAEPALEDVDRSKQIVRGE
jgi:hypothetical protein